MSSDFVILHDRALELVQVSWCPTMDLIAFITVDHQLSIYRSIKWQKLFTYTESELIDKPTELAWRPDGKTLAIGHSNGGLSLLNMETGDIQPVPRSTADRPCSSLHWVASHVPVTDNASMQDRALAFLPPMAALNDQTFIEYETTMQALPKSAPLQRSSGLDVLVTANSEGFISFMSYGSIPIGSIDFSEHLQGANVSELCLSADLQTLSVLAEHEEKLCLLTVDTSAMWKHRKELAQVTRQFEQLSSLLEYLAKAVEHVEAQWHEGMKQLGGKMKALQALLADYGRDASAEEDLYTLLMTGVPSTALAQFFASNLSEAGLSRLQKGVDTACANMQRVGCEHLQKAAEALVFRLSELRGLSRWPQRYRAVGLQEETIQLSLTAAEGVLLKAEELLVAVQEAQADFGALFGWLLRTIHRLDRVNEHDGGHRHGGVSASEIQRVAAFLRVGDNNKGGGAAEGGTKGGTALLQADVLQYFQDQPLARPVVPTTPSRHDPVDAAERALGGIPFRQVSLKQQLDQLQRCWAALLPQPAQALSRRYQLASRVRLCAVGLPAALHFQSGAAEGRGAHRNGLQFVAASLKEEAQEKESQSTVLVLRYQTYRRGKGKGKGCNNQGQGQQHQQQQQQQQQEQKQQWGVAKVALPPGAAVDDLTFYGETAGVSCANPERLCVLLNNEEGDIIAQLEYSDLEFSPLTPEQMAKLEVEGLSALALTLTVAEDDNDIKQRQLSHRMFTRVVASGSRGVACVIAPRRVTLIDLEDDDEEDDSEEEEQDDDEEEEEE